MPKSEFAGGKGSYPINDRKHAQLALNPFFLRNASPAKQKRIKTNVYKKYPELKSRSDTDKAFGEGHSHATN